MVFLNGDNKVFLARFKKPTNFNIIIMETSIICKTSRSEQGFGIKTAFASIDVGYSTTLKSNGK